ncbi:MAG: alginate lyase family protein [Flavobacterium sp.]|nr:alginate lyase family protein [Flavobacterium sp.]
MPKKLISKSDKILQSKTLYSVTHKKQIPPSGDIHDYMSVGSYWWPDSTTVDGLPYIRKDGVTNPEYYEITDSKEMDKLENDVEMLSLCYYFTKDEKYAEFATKLIENWFIDEQTKQNPNLNFGQGIKGRNTGRGTGIIETRELYKIIDASILLQTSKSWSVKNQIILKKWFSDYLKWLKESPIGIEEEDSKNNHGTYFSFQVLVFAIFSDHLEIANNEIAIIKDRLDKQISSDGSQPFELERTKSWNYVNMNMYGYFLLAKAAEKININLWNYKTKQNASIEKTLEWNLPFYSKTKAWEFEQIKDPENRDAIKLYSWELKFLINLNIKNLQ